MSNEGTGKTNEAAQTATESRRSFLRKAAAGGAAVTTLANRPAWGAACDATDPNCVSDATWLSYAPQNGGGGGVHASASPSLLKAESLDNRQILGECEVQQDADGLAWRLTDLDPDDDISCL